MINCLNGGMPTKGTAGRSPAWGADMPADEAQARERILQAAESCFAQRGPSRTKMTHIAAAAGIHRTTLYSYFPNRDAVLVACFVRATEATIEAGNEYFSGSGPFIERLIRGALAGLDVARRSPAIRSMTSPEDLAHTHHAAEQSQIWRTEVVDRLAEWFVAAEPGEVRTDVSPRMLAQWVVRICFSLIEEPGSPESGGDEGLLRAFLPGTVAPQTR